MAKKVYYYNQAYYIREEGEDREEGIKWAECPYHDNEVQKIEELARSYTNAINAAEWLEEKEAKDAFLSAGEIITAFFGTEKDAKKELLGSFTSVAGNLAGGYTISSFYNFIKDNIPGELRGQFIVQSSVKDGGEESSNEDSSDFMSGYQQTRQLKKTQEYASLIGDMKEILANLKEEKQLANCFRDAAKEGKVPELEKLSSKIRKTDKKLKKLAKSIGDSAADLVKDYFSIWAPAVVIVMYESKYRNIDWDKLKLSDPEEYKRLNKEVRDRIIFEARCNMFASDATGIITSLGVVTVKKGLESKSILAGVGIIALGFLILYLSQGISNGIKGGYREYFRQKKLQGEQIEISWDKIISIGIEEMKKFLLNFLGDLKGADTLYYTIPYKSKEILVEKPVDGPGFIRGMIAFLKTDSLDALKAQVAEGTFFNEATINSIADHFTDKEFHVDYSSIFTRDTSAKFVFRRNITKYIGPIELLGDFYQNCIKDDRDTELIAFFDIKDNDQELMEELLKDIFGSKKDKMIATNTSYLMKTIEGPIFTRRKIGYNKAVNQIIAYTYQSETTGEVDREIFRRNLAKQFPWVEYDRSRLRETIIGEYNIVVETLPYPYLVQINQYFSDEFLVKILKETIKLRGYNLMTSRYYFTIAHINTLNKEAGKYGLDLEKSKLYSYIFNLEHNNSLLQAGLVGSLSEGGNLQYIAYKPDMKYGIFGKNKNQLYGSVREIPGGDNESYHFWTGLPTEKQGYRRIKELKDNSNPAASIYINGKKIGSNNMLSRLTLIEEKPFHKNIYEQKINVDGQILNIRYTYDQNLGFYNPLQFTFSPFLKIEYRIEGVEYNKWNELIIKEFRDGDYDINIPDKGEFLAGSRDKGELWFAEIDSNYISFEGDLKKGRGKIKIKGKFLKAEGLTPIYEETGDISETGSEPQEKANVKHSRKSENSSEVIGYKDINGYKYFKDDENNLYIKYLEESNITRTLTIPGFMEGDYGLWIKEESPYYLEGNKIIDRDKKTEAPVEEILNIEENKWLKEEERIIDNFLWIYGGEEIEFPQEDIDDGALNTDDIIPLASVGVSDFQIGESGSAAGSSSVTADNSQVGQQKKENYKVPDIGDNGDYYVCHGAMLRCSKGAAPCVFNVLDKNQIYIQHRPMATIYDNTIVNIPTFGTCARQYSPPCTPQAIGPWKDGKNDVVVNNQPVLMESSTLKCAFGGTIEVINPGQQIVCE